VNGRNLRKNMLQTFSQETCLVFDASGTVGVQRWLTSRPLKNAAAERQTVGQTKSEEGVSSIASVFFVNEADLSLVCASVVPKRTFFGGHKDEFPNVIKRIAVAHADFGHSGIALVTALTYLDANGLNLMKSKHDDESSFIGKARGCSCFILTHDMLTLFARHMASNRPNIEDLQRYYNDFYETSEPGAGEAIANGFTYLESVLSSLAEDKIAVLQIG
jgi:hypothetical protein